jgi:hypothetical protein
MNKGVLTPDGSYEAVTMIWLSRPEDGREVICVPSKRYAILIFVCCSAIASICGCKPIRGANECCLGVNILKGSRLASA